MAMSRPSWMWAFVWVLSLCTIAFLMGQWVERRASVAPTGPEPAVRRPVPQSGEPTAGGTPREAVRELVLHEMVPGLDPDAAEEPGLDPRLRAAGPETVRKARAIAVIQRDHFVRVIQDAENTDDGSPTSYLAFLEAHLEHQMRVHSIESLDAGRAYRFVPMSPDDSNHTQDVFDGDPYMRYSVNFSGGDDPMIIVPVTKPEEIRQLRSSVLELRESILRNFMDAHNAKPEAERVEIYRDMYRGEGVPGLPEDVRSITTHWVQWNEEDGSIRWVKP